MDSFSHITNMNVINRVLQNLRQIMLAIRRMERST